jgi:DNA segregation ATPase FtsK/SpoIIIE, S-DNA-T family
MSQILTSDRPPRIQPELPSGEYEIPKPPEQQHDSANRLVQVALPLTTIIGYILVAMFSNSGRSPAMMIPMALSVIASVVFSLYSFRKEAEQRALEREAYSKRLLDLYREMRAGHEAQRRFAHYNYPDPVRTRDIVAHARAVAAAPTHSPNDVVRLWERRIGDEDFGVLRLGTATIPSTVVYSAKGIDGNSPLDRDANRLAADSLYVESMPVRVSIRRFRKPEPQEDEAEDPAEERSGPALPPFCHALAIAGDAVPAGDLARAALVHLTTFHAPSDLRLMLLADRRADWEWITRMPHTGAGDEGTGALFLDAPQPARTDLFDQGTALDRWAESLRRLLAQRKIRLQNNEQQQQQAEDPTYPQILVVVDLRYGADNDQHPLHRFAMSDAGLGILIAEGEQLGAAVLFLVPRRSKVPSGCSTVVEVESVAEQTVFRYAEVGINSMRLTGSADTISDQQACLELAEAQAQLKLVQSEGSALAKSVPFLEMMVGRGAQPADITIEKLVEQARAGWQQTQQAGSDHWLRARIGYMPGNKERTLVFTANRDGVHGIIAGSTGSGKSELLISLIAAMAVNYSPEALNFVLVDFKGGGAFNEFRRLPHCVDVITNLNGDAVTRMFASIQAELTRRQQLLNSVPNVKSIADYRRQGHHLSRHPFPFLFIVIDEFAEMIADRVETKSQLEQITRIGRTLGVHLLLAAQRPSGVTDQMRSNIKFRISLRVESPAESRELLRRTEAAYLPNNIPGRGYLQVGNDEIELIQVAYAGDPYIPPGRRPAPPVRWLRHSAKLAALESPPERVYSEVIKALARLAQEQNVPTQVAPWPNPLPELLTLTDPLTEPRLPDGTAITDARFIAERERISYSYDAHDEIKSLSPWLERWLTDGTGWSSPVDWRRTMLQPVIGLIDSPAAARQYPLTIDLPSGHVIVYGGPGAGKTMFIRSLITSLAASHAPDQLHAYVLDLGGRSLMPLAEFPHVGAVITPNESEAGYRERVEQLLRELNDLVERRKQVFSEVQLDSLSEFNARYPERALPAIVLAIDNMTEFVEVFGAEIEGGINGLQRLTALTRQCKPYGVHIVLTAVQPSQIPAQLVNFLTERFALSMIDPALYRDALGPYAVVHVETAGRGYTVIDQHALTVQIATADVPMIEQTAGRQQAAVAGWPEERRARLPFKVDALPNAVLLRTILARDAGVDDAAYRKTLARRMYELWQQSLLPEKADWLRAEIGVTSGNKTRTLYFAAKADGVHGMIAGGTGAGKSELLMSLVTSLALRYDPSVLNFVLIDYKGGGAFEPFRRLPHVVDLVTNLNKNAVRRMFTAIGAEMDRRSGVLAGHDVKDVVEYRKKGLHLSKEPGLGPMPHLMIIIDEYAEMISDSPEFRDELDRITRIGRSIGVNLLLASQRPVGVTDQMRANIKLRLCLRVEGIDTSREMLRRPDAAFLPNGIPGRGYLQIGNEQLELCQVSFTGEKVPGAATNERGEELRFFEVIVGVAVRSMERDNRSNPPAPWPPDLPSELVFDPWNPAQLSADARALLLRRQADGISLSPGVAAWLHGHGTWPAVNWAELPRGVVGLVDDPRGSRQLPLQIQLNHGHAILFAGPSTGKSTFVRSLVLSLAAAYPPDALHIHVLDLGGRSHQLLNTLPHVGTVIVPDDKGYAEQIELLWRDLANLLRERKELFTQHGAQSLLEYNSRFPAHALPAVVLIVDPLTDLIEAFAPKGGEEDEDNIVEQFITLLRQGRSYGVHVMVSAGRLNSISPKLYSLFSERYTLRLMDAEDYTGIVGARVDQLDEIAGRGYTVIERRPMGFQVAVLPPAADGEQNDKARIDRIGEAMHAAISRLQPAFTAPRRLSALPDAVLFSEIVARHFGFPYTAGSFTSDMQRAMAASWAVTVNSDQWLNVPFAVASGNTLRNVVLSAEADGVHGMLAGGTGSGKTEALISFIIGLAMVYPPSIVNFVLVDYKGGGAFSPIAHLPHIVETVTNLGKSGVERMFAAIRAELNRRQLLNKETETKNIVDYRKKGFHRQRPYPHLIIIIDEYAEMIDENPEYRAQLESITRVGRAQGVHLLLASQRPKGVTDQMRANIRLRLCLKVEDIDTSRELLRRPDAARLPTGRPGRGFLQGGKDRIELLQVAWSGHDTPADEFPPVRWLRTQQELARQRREAEQRGEKPPRGAPLFMTAAVLAQQLNDGRPVPRPWPAVLPTSFSLETVLPDWQRQLERGTQILRPQLADWLIAETEQLWPGVNWQTSALRAIVGLVDDPETARQDALELDLGRMQLAVFGDAGSGKTSLLRTLAFSLMLTHRPDELHLYVIDMAGQSFRAFEQFPHVGALISSDEELFDERLRRLLDFLARLADERQQQIARAEVNSFLEYNQRNPQQPLPAVLFMVDNIAALTESYDTLVEQALVPLVRRAQAVGISVVVAGNAPNAMISRLNALFTERLTFRQANFDRYIDIVGKGAVELEDIPGRGYMRISGRPRLLQAAQPIGIYDGDGRSLRQELLDLRAVGEQMRHVADARAIGNRPRPIETLAHEVSLAQLAAVTDDGPAQITVGIGGNLQPLTLDLRRSGPHFVISGGPLSGRTTLLRTMILRVADQHHPQIVDMVLVDLQNRLQDHGGSSDLAVLPHVAHSINDIDQFEALVDWLELAAPALAESKRKLLVFIDNFDELAEELDSKMALKTRLSRLLRRYGRDGLHVVVTVGTEQSMGDVRKRLQASGYGLGLRTDAAVAALKVMRLPAGLEGRPLPIGRGYLVKSGQTFLTQLATPYPLTAGGDEEQQIAAAMDDWIGRISARYPARTRTALEEAVDPAIVRLQQLVIRSREALRSSDDSDAPALLGEIEALAVEQIRERAPLMTLLRKALTIFTLPATRFIVDTFDDNSVPQLLEHELNQREGTL